MKKKKRWRSAFGGIRPRFTYAGDTQGKIVFFRNGNPFNWEPLAIDRAAARVLVDQLNELKGKDVNAIGKPLTEKFVADARKAAKIEAAALALYSDGGKTAEIAGRAESRAKEREQNHATKNKDDAGRSGR